MYREIISNEAVILYDLVVQYIKSRNVSNFSSCLHYWNIKVIFFYQKILYIFFYLKLFKSLDIKKWKVHMDVTSFFFTFVVFFLLHFLPSLGPHNVE